MTRATGRAAVSSMVSAMSCSASSAGTSAPRSVATSPRRNPAIAVRLAFAERRPDPEGVEERVQRQLLAELVPGPPEDLAAPLRPVVRTRA